MNWRRRASTRSITETTRSFAIRKNTRRSSTRSPPKFGEREQRRDKSVLEIVYSTLARQDVAEIASWTEDRFGERTTGRYLSLIRKAADDLAADPVRHGSADRAEVLPGLRIYHLYHSRRRAGKIVIKKPRHFLAFRVRGQKLEVGRISCTTKWTIDEKIASEGFNGFELNHRANASTPRDGSAFRIEKPDAASSRSRRPLLTIFMRPSAMRPVLPATRAPGEPSTASPRRPATRRPPGWSPGIEFPESPARMLSSKVRIRGSESGSPSCFVSSAAETALHPSCPSTP